MATVTKENIGLLHEKLTLRLEKSDYLPSFEKVLKDYSKKANIPGFRKGQVPASLIKKMYGTSLFTDEVLRSVDRELVNYLETDKLDIFAQPLPLEMDMRQLDVNNPTDYTFQFEIGMKPDFKLPDLAKANITNFKVAVTDEMINGEITRLQNRFGTMQEPGLVDNEENVLNLVFTEVDEAGNEVSEGIKKDNSLLVKYFKEDLRKQLMGKKTDDSLVLRLEDAFDSKELDWVMSDLGLDKNDPSQAKKKFMIRFTKVGLLEKKELNEEFFNQLYPGQEIKTEEAVREKISGEIAAYWANQARNQIHDQVFHELVDHTEIKFPEGFLKKWLQTQGDPEKKEAGGKSEEEVEKEFPGFLNQLKWTVISDKIVHDQGLEVTQDEIRDFATQQLVSYMGNASMDPSQQWVKDYIEKMMKDRKYVEDAYTKIQSQKVLQWTETQVKPADKEIGAEEFRKMVEEHRHHHH
ncbi:MAG TPA: trigger factor [Chitinophagaceae bacterium]|nr:trigger factor [Chitinophagaceae bacterium]